MKEAKYDLGMATPKVPQRMTNLEQITPLSHLSTGLRVKGPSQVEN